MRRRYVYYPQWARTPEIQPAVPDTSYEWKADYPDVTTWRRPRLIPIGHFGVVDDELDVSTEWLGTYPDLIPGRARPRQNLGGVFTAPTDEVGAPADVSTEWIGTYPVIIRRRKPQRNFGGIFTAPTDEPGIIPDVSTDWMGNFPATLLRRIPQQNLGGMFSTPEFITPLVGPSLTRVKRVIGGGIWP